MHKELSHDRIPGMQELAVLDIPDDVETLKALVVSQNRIIKNFERELAWAEEKYRAMELRYFGRKSEKYSPEEDRQNVSDNFNALQNNLLA